VYVCMYACMCMCVYIFFFYILEVMFVLDDASASRGFLTYLLTLNCIFLMISVLEDVNKLIELNWIVDISDVVRLKIAPGILSISSSC